MSERITSEQVQSDVESYALRASPDGRRRVIREALDKARREGGEDAQAEVARLREALAASEALRDSSTRSSNASHASAAFAARATHDSTRWEGGRDGETMRTTKEELAWLRCLADEAWEGRAQETLRRAIDAADRARMADDALTTIALAAGLGADATAEEVAARVGELREAERLLVAEVRAHAFADSFSEADRLRPTMEAFEAHIAGQRATVARLLLSRRLAEESGRG